MRVTRQFTTSGIDPYDDVEFERRESRIVNPDGSIVFEANDLVMPNDWSQVAVDIMAQKYFRKAGVPTVLRPIPEDDVPEWLWRSQSDPTSDDSGGEQDARQVFRRLAGTWTYWGWKNGYFDSEEDALAFHDELCYMLATQKAAPNSPQWFNTGLHWAYGISGPAQGHWYVDSENGEPQRSTSAYERPQPHACFIQSVDDDLVNDGGIMDLWTREARIFKYGSGTGSNFSKLRGADESLSGGGKSSGLMSFLKIGDRAAGAIKSGGTTRRAAKMVVVDIDHPDIETFIDWKVDEEQKVAAMVTGSRVMRRHLNAVFEAACADLNQETNPALHHAISSSRRDSVPEGYIQQVLQSVGEGAPNLDLARFDYDWQGDAYQTVSGQNANNSVRVTNEFLSAVSENHDWDLIRRTDGAIHRTVGARDLWDRISRAAWLSADPGIQYDTTINEWHTSPTEGRIEASNPCSEYMFLDDTACNLASINLLKFTNDTGTELDVEAFEHASRLWTIVLEISVLMAQFPSHEIARRSYDYRTLGLGYANLGALLMVNGIPYDSPEALAWTGAISAILTGTSYATSAEMSGELGPFVRFEENRDHMLRVIRNHRRAAYNAPAEQYEGLSTLPTPIDESICPPDLLLGARQSWDQALSLGEKNGYRNAQATLIAPTGTIGLLMDCDTTGVEPDFALVKFKKLAGGGYFRIINQAVPAALKQLGYSHEQIEEIVVYCAGNGRLQGAPYINRHTLASKGFTQPALDTLDDTLGTAFHLRFAFNRHLLGDEFCRDALGFSDEQLDDPTFDILEALGFSHDQVEEANDYIQGRLTLEGAPHLSPEHYSVFDCATKCGKHGTRFIEPMAHVRILAAAQPFLSGAISKTINMPNEATINDVSSVYEAAASGMVKALALYRDGSKLSQPLAASTSDDLTEGPEETSAHDTSTARTSSAQPAIEEAERIIRALPDAELERLLQLFSSTTTEEQRGARVGLPSRRSGYAQKAYVGGHAIYLHTGEFEDGQLGEIFISMAKDGAAFRSVMNCFAIAVSIGIQHGVPLEAFVDSFVFTKFEPNGIVTGHDRIQMATSIIDYIFRDLAVTYLGRDDLAHLGSVDLSPESTAEDGTLEEYTSSIPETPDPAVDAVPVATSVRSPLSTEEKTVEETLPALEPGLPTSAVIDDLTVSSTDRDSVVVTSQHPTSTASAPIESSVGSAPAQRGDALPTADIARQSGFVGDPCDECGQLMMVRSGTCLKCMSCGATSGCS